MLESFTEYTGRLVSAVESIDLTAVEALERELADRIDNRKRIFICGNGGSAGNAIHIENDFLYGVRKKSGAGADITALPANSSVLTCLANDLDYSAIYSEQLMVKAQAGDLLIVLSGSGNSPNILQALRTAIQMGIRTAALLGYSGGEARNLADIVIHAEIDDMQISEDVQLIVMHHLMQRLYAAGGAETGVAK